MPVCEVCPGSQSCSVSYTQGQLAHEPRRGTLGETLSLGFEKELTAATLFSDSFLYVVPVLTVEWFLVGTLVGGRPSEDCASA